MRMAGSANQVLEQSLNSAFRAWVNQFCPLNPRHGGTSRAIGLVRDMVRQKVRAELLDQALTHSDVREGPAEVVRRQGFPTTLLASTIGARASVTCPNLDRDGNTNGLSLPS
jgi:hypothetical protein